MTNAVPDWLNGCLSDAAGLVNDPTPQTSFGASVALRLGIDLGTSDVVSMVLDKNNRPVAVCLEWADVVRDGIVLNFHGAVTIVRRQLAELKAKLGVVFEKANTSYPPGTDPRISVNVLEAAGLEVATVIDEPSAVGRLLALDRAAVVDIGGGTTGVAVLRDGKVVYSGDEPTGGHHVTLTIAGANGLSLEEAEAHKIAHGREVWTIVCPVFEKMTDIVRKHINGHEIDTLYLSGGSCALPGVRELFQQEFPEYMVALPDNPIFLTPLAIAAYRPETV
ncbi:MAG: ethanolamine utilization protein EutJ [Desulfovibrio sp.]|jgi:ethanolamine utilization protein EutJ|nr:ethanolamine utilization protein EutJ [Desulfovibrio sp.]